MMEDQTQYFAGSRKRFPRYGKFQRKVKNATLSMSQNDFLAQASENFYSSPKNAVRHVDKLT